MPTDFVRARMPDGTHVTVSRQYAKMLGLKILPGRPAVNRAGIPLPQKNPILRAARNSKPTTTKE